MSKQKNDKHNNDIGKTSDLLAQDEKEKKRENTRSYIAMIYVVAYLFIIGSSLIFGLLNNSSVDDNRDILLAISGILSGPLGFIIGYYFKASTE